jgi:calcineurin-like phosphoesterase family protein
MIWFTSDTHFDHTAIISYCGRPAANKELMNEMLIDKWNERVAADDTVYHLGDVAFCNREKTASILDRLKGRKILIRGNHDANGICTLGQWDEVHEEPLVRAFYGQALVMLHYPMEAWPHSTHGSIHLHGHTHGRLDNYAERMDVGVDAMGQYAPISISEILIMNKGLPSFWDTRELM